MAPDATRVIRQQMDRNRSLGRGRAYAVDVVARRDQDVEVAGDERASLEAAKEQKYRDIRDAELDFRMGKLSEEDWREADRELRAQAVEILVRLDHLGGTG